MVPAVAGVRADRRMRLSTAGNAYGGSARADWGESLARSAAAPTLSVRG